MTSIGSFVAFGSNSWIIGIDSNNEHSEHGGILGAGGSVRNMGELRHLE